MDHELPTGWPDGSEFAGNLMCSPQALPPMASAKPTGKSPLCKVCGDESSGFHYGVDSCEGCKGFFRRCITQGMTHKCANEEKCEITPFTRNSCQYCRLKKCFAVGMSREASRLGRRPKRLKEPGGEGSKSHCSNLPIAPYPSPAELYRMRMAELQKLLQANGTFKSELMQAFLSAAQASFREHAKHSGSSGQPPQPSMGGQGFMDPLASNGGQGMPTDFMNQSQGQFSGGLHPSESGYSGISSPPDSKNQSPMMDPLSALSDGSPFFDNSGLYGNTLTSSSSLNGSNSSLVSPTSTTGYGSSSAHFCSGDMYGNVKVKVEPGLEMSTACSFAGTTTTAAIASPATATATSSVRSVSTDSHSILEDFDPNDTQDGEMLLEEVKMPLSDTRRLLIDQVTDAVVEAHLATCMNTYNNLVEANERLARKDPKSEPQDNKAKAMVMWQYFLSRMCPEITMVVTFCKRLPGFAEIEQDDQIRLIKQGSFEVLLARFCMLVDNELELMMDPSHKIKCSREVILAMPMGNFFKEFFTIAAFFNPLKLTDGEIGLFTSILIICPERCGLKNKKAIGKIQSLFMQALYYLMKRNHPDPGNQFVKLMNTIKMFRSVNNEHAKALNDIKMTMPESYDKQFHPLHHEVFDNKI